MNLLYETGGTVLYSRSTNGVGRAGVRLTKHEDFFALWNIVREEDEIEGGFITRYELREVFDIGADAIEAAVAVWQK